MKETFLDSLLRELRIKKVKNIAVKINTLKLRIKVSVKKIYYFKQECSVKMFDTCSILC